MTKKIINLFLVMAILLSFGIMGTTTASAAEPTTFFYVAPNGNDTAAGTMESPFATMVGARDAIRNLKKTSGLPDGGVVVYIRGGFYPVTEEITFTEEDSGTETSPIIYKAYPGEKPIISGGTRIPGSDFKPVTDIEILERLNNVHVRKNLVAVNLKDYGYTEIPQWDAGVDFDEPPGLMVFINDNYVSCARYPNINEEENNDVEWLRADEFIIPHKAEDGSGVKFKYSDSRPEKWKEPETCVVVRSSLGYDACFSIVKEVDTTERTIWMKYPHRWGAAANSRYLYMNVLEELDVQNEYYIDVKTGMLYLYPPKGVDLKNVTVDVTKYGNTSDDTLIRFHNKAHDMTLSGLRVELSRTNGITVHGCKNILITNCEVNNHGLTNVGIGGRYESEFGLGARGVWMALHCKKYINDERAKNVNFNRSDYKVASYEDHEKYNVENCGITNSEVLNAGLHSVVICGGDRLDLIPGNNYATNNLILHSGLAFYHNGQLLTIMGMNNYASYNTMAYCQGIGVYYAGNELIIEHNDISHAVRSGGDLGMFYCAGWYAEMNIGTEIRYNYLHDIENEDEKDSNLAPIDTGVARRNVLYNDNCQPFFEVHHNIIEDAVYGHFQASGYENNVRDNLFIDVRVPIRMFKNNMCETQYMETGSPIGALALCEYEVLRDTFPENLKLWLERYPEVQEVVDKMIERKELCKHPDSEILRNVMVFDKYKDFCEESYTDASCDDRYCTIEDNIWLIKDPGFVDLKNGDYRWRDNAAIFKTHPEMRNVDITKMGVNKGELYNKFANSVSLKVGNPNAVAFGSAKLIDSNNPVVAPLIVDSRTLVPVRFISESFGGEVGWDDATRTVTIKIDGKTVTMVLDKNELMIDGAVAATMDVPAQSIEGRTMVPLRALCETVLNKNVFWDNRGLIVISDDAGFLDAEKDKTVIDDMVKFVTVY